MLAVLRNGAHARVSVEERTAHEPRLWAAAAPAKAATTAKDFILT
jgi:hypothetical protein